MAEILVTEKDRIYYANVIDKLGSLFDIFESFHKYDGMPNIPNEDIMDFLIKSFKEWIVSKEGASWLEDLGYHKKTKDGSFIKYELVQECECCSELISEIEFYTCEKCGKKICSSCSNIVNEAYDIRWCNSCL